MKEMVQLIKSKTKTPVTSNETKQEKKKKRDEKRKKYNKAPICKHCDKKHPLKKEDKCCKLETNKASHPNNWKSTKGVN
jgi:hypothetical protein